MPQKRGSMVTLEDRLQRFKDELEDIEQQLVDNLAEQDCYRDEEFNLRGSIKSLKETIKAIDI
jgi:chromosome segregation ATPase